MPSDDFDVIIFKVLSYIMECAKADTAPNIRKAQEVAKANDTMWAMVVLSMLDDGLITGARVDDYINGISGVVGLPSFGITAKGARFLKDNDRMRAVARFLGSAFTGILELAVKATAAL